MKNNKFMRLVAATLLAGLIFTSCASDQSVEQEQTAITGAAGTVFQLKDTESGFDYAADLCGASTYLNDSEEIAETIGGFKISYGEYGIDYAAVVIPEKYQIYSSELTQKSGMTVAEAVCRQLISNGFAPLLDMTLPLRDTAGIRTFESAGSNDSLNTYGGYIIYHTAVNDIDELSQAKTDCKEIELTDADFVESTSEDEKNISAALGKKFDTSYETTQKDASVTVTELTNFERVKRTSSPCIAIIGSEALNNSVMPYFSQAFKKVCYFTQMPDGAALEALGVKYVLHMLNTSGLIALKSTVINTQQNSESLSLRIIRQIDSRDSLTGVEYKLLCGECPPESTIRITGSNIDTIEQFCGRSRFFIPVKFKSNKKCSLNIAVVDENGVEGEAIDVDCSKIKNYQMTTFSLGKNNFVHWPDMAEYLCNNYNSVRGMQTIYRSLNKRFENIRAAAGDDTKFCIMVMPDPLVLYDDSASDELAALRVSSIEQYNAAQNDNVDPSAEIYTNMNKLVDYIKSQNPEFEIIDMTPILRELKNKETYPRLYHTTDNHWSSLGAYYGYREIMNYVYETSGIEATKPLELSDFDITEYHLSYANQLGIPDPRSEDIFEVVDLLVSHIPRVAQLTSGTINNDGRFWSDVQGFMSFTTGKTELPSAVFLRDSFTTALYPMLNEHFCDTYYSDTWNFSIDYDWLAQTNPDYVFVIAVERLIGSALTQR